MIRIGSNIDIGMNRNSSDWLEMNSYPILSPGGSTTEFFQFGTLFLNFIAMQRLF